MNAEISLLNLLDGPPQAIEELAAAASAEGYDHIERLAGEFRAGAHAFRAPGCGLLGAMVLTGKGPRIAAVGGMTPDPFDAALLRMRRFFVRHEYRRFGIATRLAGALLVQSQSSGKRIVVHAGDDRSRAFWERMNFMPVMSHPHTHEFVRSVQNDG